MKTLSKLIVTAAAALMCTALPGQVMSFEEAGIPDGFSISKGKLSLTGTKYKLGKQSLKISWKGNAVMYISNPEGMEEASAGRNGGMNVWIYNETPVNDDLVFIFRDKTGEELCRLPFRMGFKGWRCIWAKFRADMGMEQDGTIASAELHFPAGVKKGTTYIDMLEFTRNVSWQNMSDAQYKVNRTDFSLIPDFNGYRNVEKKVKDLITADREQIAVISDRLTGWYLGNGEAPGNRLSSIRDEKEREFIRSGVEKASRYRTDTPLFPLGAPDKVNGEKCVKFREINENVLIPLALDYRKNGNKESLYRIMEIYDWFNDQGWADGSGMGTLTFERLRSSGYFHSFFLVKDELSPEMLERELDTFDWFSLFGICFTEPECKGEVADNLRGLAIAKLIYALSLTDLVEQQTALTAFKNYMDNALGLAPGYFGTIKPDFSGYHHRGAYHSAYYPHALYAGSFIAYLLHGTPYALSDETVRNLKEGLLNFRFFCAGLDVPAATTGRFPESQEILQTILPAFAYAAFCSDEPDPELTAAFKRIISDERNSKAIEDYAVTVKSSLAYTSTVGEMEMMARLARLDIGMEPSPEGARFYPYSGLLVTKDAETQFNIKGFSRYIWDFESSATENIHGRYVSYGHIEYFDFRNGRKSFNPRQELWEWNYMPGTTTRVLPLNLLQDKGGAESGHRNFSDESFLAGVAVSDSLAMFSVRLHDIAYDKSFRANKSVFIFRDWLFCLGSDINCSDSEHPVVTTLLQSFDNSFSGETADGGYIAEDGSFIYAVKDGTVRTFVRDSCARAFIDHGTSPENQGYSYFIIKNKDRNTAEALLSGECPVDVLERDNDAHIIRNNSTGTVCGAIFNADREYEGIPVSSTNIPLAFIFEDSGGNGPDRLHICEPDMRRPYKAHMGLLTEQDVIAEETPFSTTVMLPGHFDVKSLDKEAVAEYDSESDMTSIIISTIRGENYSFELHRIR